MITNFFKRFSAKKDNKGFHVKHLIQKANVDGDYHEKEHALAQVVA